MNVNITMIPVIQMPVAQILKDHSLVLVYLVILEMALKFVWVSTKQLHLRPLNYK